MFSVVMATFNNEDTLLETINSILQQSYPHFELIIVDDSSTDTTQEVLNSFKDERIVKLRNYQNQGLAYSLNRGIQIARYDWIIRMDADDVMLINRLEITRSYVKPDLEMLAFSAVSSTGAKSTIPKVKFWKAPYMFLFKNKIVHPAVAIRKQVLMDIQYNPGLRRAQDVDLWIRFAKRKIRVHVVQIPVIIYREKITKKKNETAHKFIEEIERKNFDYWLLKALLKLKKFWLDI